MTRAARSARKTPEKLRELGALYSEVGSFYRNRGKFDKGERAYQEALGFYDQAKEITDGGRRKF